MTDRVTKQRIIKTYRDFIAIKNKHKEGIKKINSFIDSPEANESTLSLKQFQNILTSGEFSTQALVDMYVGQTLKAIFNGNGDKFQIIFEARLYIVSSSKPNYYLNKDKNSISGFIHNGFEILKNDEPELYHTVRDVFYMALGLYAYNLQIDKIDKDNIYTITNPYINKFSDVKHSKELTLEDVLGSVTEPMFFISENNTVCFLEKKIINSSKNGAITGYYFTTYITGKKHFDFNTLAFPAHFNLNEIVEVLSDKDSSAQLVKIILHTITLIKAQEIEITYDEYNEDRLVLLDNLKKTGNKKYKTRLKHVPEYRFIDLDLTLENYTKKYYEKVYENNERTGDPFLVRTHWHQYWVGSERTGDRHKEWRLVLKYWKGDISSYSPEELSLLEKKYDNQKTFKVFK